MKKEVAPAPAPAPATPSLPRCFRCNQPGHYANKCPRLTSAPSARPATNHHIDFDSQQETPPSPSASSASVNDALDALNGIHTSLHTIEAGAASPHGPIQAPICLASTVELMAYVDTGASHSVIRQSLLDALPADIRSSFIPAPRDSTVSLGARDVVTPRIGSVQVPFTWNGRQLSHRFEILDRPADIDVIVGRDLLSPLGIGITRLPLPSAPPTPELPPEDDTAPLAEGSDGADHQLARHQRLLDAISRNQAIPRNSFCTLPESIVFLHTGDASPVYRRQYGSAHALEPIINKQIEQWLEDGKVTYAPRGCQWNHPLLVVPKKTADGSKAPGRVCIDPRGLNRLLVPEKFPLPRVRDVFDAMTGKALFSSLDLEQSFLQLRIHPEHQQKVAFTWSGNHYMFVGTPFGLTPTSAVLQRTVSSIFHGMQRIVPFQDDITIGSDNADQHLDDVVTAIDALTAVNLRLRTSKRQFFKRSFHVLGHVLSAHGIQIDKRKLTVIPAQRPGTGKDIKRFLGLTNYFRDFVPDYSTLAAPLERLRHMGDIPDEVWERLPSTAYLPLVRVLKEAPMLSLPDFDHEFSVAVDASATGLGAVLYQLRDPASDDTIGNRLWVVFAARALHAAERNYSATKRELLAIVFALRRFHFYIWGRPFRLYSDHRSLTFLLSQKELSPMMSGWLEIILSYTFTIDHRPGVLNMLPDALSRLYPAAMQVSAKEASALLQSQADPQRQPLPESERPTAIANAHLQGHFGVRATMSSLIRRQKAWLHPAYADHGL